MQIHSLRNIGDASLGLCPGGNFFFGMNGAGKTSVLEAAHFLSTGRSFRAGAPRTMIQHSKEACRVVGQVVTTSGDVTMGIERQRNGALKARVAGQDVTSLTQLAERLPVVLLDTESLSLLTGPPEGRRRFLDGTVFHVEQPFISVWRRYQRALRQRNAGLRHGTMSPDGAWLEELAGAGELLTTARRNVLERLSQHTVALAQQMSAELDALSLELRQGWDAEESLSASLARSLESDRRQGFTQVGPHRADVRVTINGRAAADVLSRGQMKVLVSAMRLAQGREVEAHGRFRPTYLIDDLLAELDVLHARKACEQLAATGSQVLMTAVDQGALLDWWVGAPARVFHVEHGGVRSADEK